MTLTTILCPLDFSAASAALVAYAAALAVGTGAELRLLYVQEPATPVAAGVEAELSAHRAAAQAAGASRVSTYTLHGEAAPEIVAEARRQHADLIVIGAHGQTGLSRFLMGNTAEVVVRTAPCPTMLVRE
jgi:nucleotide-binding universal stress UspA family protein